MNQHVERVWEKSQRLLGTPIVPVVASQVTFVKHVEVYTFNPWCFDKKVYWPPR